MFFKVTWLTVMVLLIIPEIDMSKAQNTDLTSAESRVWLEILQIMVIVLTPIMLMKGLQIITNCRTPVVYSDGSSMEPTLRKGDLLFLSNNHQLEVGDIVAFTARNVLVSHRIIVLRKKNDRFNILTKGDNNVHSDQSLYGLGKFWLNEHDIVGKVIFKLPFLGYIFFYIREHPLVRVYLVAMSVGAITSGSNDERIFLTEMTIIVIVAIVKFSFLIWRKQEVLDILEQTSIFSVQDYASFMLVKEKRKTITDLAVVLFVTLHVAVIFATIVVPFFGSERQLFFNIALPFDWRNSEISFWVSSVFIFTGVYLSLVSILMSIIIWYSMVNCAVRYEILGMDIRNMGKIKGQEGRENQREMSVQARQMLFQQDLMNAVDNHQAIRKLTSDLSSYFSNLFFLQIITGSLSICGSIYCITFVGKGLVEITIHIGTLMYNIAEIFMISRLSNEIRLSSDRLTYCLFESEWIDESRLTKKNIMTFGVLIKRSHVLVVGKLYPLTLELFTKLCRHALLGCCERLNLYHNLKQIPRMEWLLFLSKRTLIYLTIETGLIQEKPEKDKSA